MAINKLHYDMDGLDKIRKSLEKAKDFRAQVGIFENKDARAASGSQGLGNADIGFRHEFGFTISEGPFQGIRVAARSFLRMPIRTHIEQIAKMMKTDAMILLQQCKVELLFKRLGIAATNTILEAFQTSGWGTWKENSPVTIILKGSDKPLIDTAQLERSIVSRVTK